MLEPEHQFVVRAVCVNNDCTPSLQVIPRIVRPVAGPEKILRPHTDQVLIAQAGWDWPVVEWVSPYRPLPRDTGQGERVRD